MPAARGVFDRRLPGVVVALSLSLVTLAAAPVPRPPTTGRVTGTVRDGAGAPVAHAELQVVGTALTALTDTAGVNWGPYWHPTKQLIIWSGADHSDPNARPNYDLWLAHYQVQGSTFHLGSPIRVTDFAGADVLPVFSPDGKQLMWTSTRTDDHSSQLFLADFHLPE